MNKITIYNEVMPSDQALIHIAKIIADGMDFKPCQLNGLFFSTTNKKHTVLCSKKDDEIIFKIRMAEVGD